MPVLPLFPLGDVLLPGGVLALQIFEPRYVHLVRALLALPEDRRTFGVVAIRRGLEVGPDAAEELYGVGCEARVVRMTRLASPGSPRFGLTAMGARRFALESLEATAGTPYTTARVSWLADLPEAAAPTADDPGALMQDPGLWSSGALALAADLRDEHAAYLRLLPAPPVPLPENPGELAFRVTDHCVLAPADRQRVLEAPDVLARLAIALELVRRERSLLSRFGALPGPIGPGATPLN